MKKALLQTTFPTLLLWLSVLTMTACMTEGEEAPIKEDEYYLKFKVGGVEKKFSALPNSMASFFYLEEAKIFGGQISGINNILEPTKNFVIIQLFNETAYQANLSYQQQDPVTFDLISRSRIIFTYADENEKVYNAALLKAQHPTLDIKDEAEVRFTEMTPAYVKGTFSARVGEVNFTVLSNRKELLITEGEFYLPRNDGTN